MCIRSRGRCSPSDRAGDIEDLTPRQPFDLAQVSADRVPVNDRGDG